MDMSPREKLLAFFDMCKNTDERVMLDTDEKFDDRVDAFKAFVMFQWVIREVTDLDTDLLRLKQLTQSASESYFEKGDGPLGQSLAEISEIIGKVLAE